MAVINQPNLSDWEQKYASNISGLAKYNNVDLGVAADMLKSNLSGSGSYKGGGVLDFNIAKTDYNNAINADKNQINKSSGTGATPRQTPISPAEDYYSKLLAETERANQLAQQKAEEAQRIRTEQAVSANNAYIPQINQQYERQQQENYIANQLARMNMPQNLAALGMTGGASESALLGLDTSYQNVRNTTDTEKNNALTDIRNNEANIRATGDAGLADIASQYYNQYVQNVANAQANAQAQANWQAEFDSRQQDSAYQNQVDDAKLRASYGDYSGLKALGIDLTGMDTTSSKSEGGTKPGTKSEQAFDNTKVTQLINGLGNFMISQGNKEAAATQILSLYNTGSLSKSEANYILAKFGLPTL